MKSSTFRLRKSLAAAIF